MWLLLSCCFFCVVCSWSLEIFLCFFFGVYKWNGKQLSFDFCQSLLSARVCVFVCLLLFLVNSRYRSLLCGIFDSWEMRENSSNSHHEWINRECVSVHVVIVVVIAAAVELFAFTIGLLFRWPPYAHYSFSNNGWKQKKTLNKISTPFFIQCSAMCVCASAVHKPKRIFDDLLHSSLDGFTIFFLLVALGLFIVFLFVLSISHDHETMELISLWQRFELWLCCLLVTTSRYM